METTLGLAGLRRFNLLLYECQPSFFAVAAFRARPGKTNRQDETIKLHNLRSRAPPGTRARCVIITEFAPETPSPLLMYCLEQPHAYHTWTFRF